ncbi:GNAT family N-acetyltransferase [Roseomonas sp. OT10]|uniref:GNAT family N-acetyltransferase n=1 Tax=Roseomonas cutis TaxID=2897332 RepID=UPI001E2E87F3|nr:GNAT family N-acetyltransferase [Roseomonas sp. OT10]UFN50037.1 GNAT family N-acetyltransferase [Roseomonas sp. OT10]
MILEASRLILRPWCAADREPFAALNAEPAVQRHLLPLDRAGYDAMLDRIDAHFATHGWGFWAVEHRAEGVLIGLCGLARIPWEAEFTPAVEIGWRLATRWQGQGLAREAASLALDAGFGPIGLERIVAFTVPANTASWGLMERLGMRRGGEFGHPRLAPDHPQHRHLWYETDAAAWRAGPGRSAGEGHRPGGEGGPPAGRPGVTGGRGP